MQSSVLRTLAPLGLVAVLLSSVAAGEESENLSAIIKTNRGEIHLELFADDAPLTVANFANLAKRGFYDGLTFHRVIADFMIQGGDPTGTGMGGPGYKFKDETTPNRKHEGPGILSMANSGPNTNGSQFFITHKATPWLDKKHTVFGRVTKGQEVVDATKQGDRMEKVTIVGDTGPLFEAHAKQLEEWNKLIDQAAEKAKADAEARDKESAALRSRVESETGKTFTKTDSGLLVLHEIEGEGPNPSPNDTVRVHYKGTLMNGKQFDSSYDRGQPIEFPLNRVIAGWTEGVGLMRKGGKAHLIIPPDLGYGAGGTGPIPPNATLYFVVELLDIK